MSREEEIETLLNQIKVYEQSLVSLGRNKSKFEANIMVVVHDFSEQVKLLKEAVSRNDETSKSIADKITKTLKCTYVPILMRLNNNCSL